MTRRARRVEVVTARISATISARGAFSLAASLTISLAVAPSVRLRCSSTRCLAVLNGLAMAPPYDFRKPRLDENPRRADHGKDPLAIFDGYTATEEVGNGGHEGASGNG